MELSTAGSTWWATPCFDGFFQRAFRPIQRCLVTFQRMNSKGCLERESNITLEPKKKLMGSARIAHSHTAPFSRWHSGFIIINICFWWTQKQPRKAKKMHATRMQRIVVKLANPAIKISNHKTTELQKCNLKLQIHMELCRLLHYLYRLMHSLFVLSGQLKVHFLLLLYKFICISTSC